MDALPRGDGDLTHHRRGAARRVLAAEDLDVRAHRLVTLESIADIEQLPIDEMVARSWALLRVHLAKNKRRLNVNDLWIAATVLAYDIPVVTQDDNFGPLDTVAGLSVLQV